MHSWVLGAGASAGLFAATWMGAVTGPDTPWASGQPRLAVRAPTGEAPSGRVTRGSANWSAETIPRPDQKNMRARVRVAGEASTPVRESRGLRAESPAVELPPEIVSALRETEGIKDLAANPEALARRIQGLEASPERLRELRAFAEMFVQLPDADGTVRGSQTRDNPSALSSGR